MKRTGKERIMGIFYKMRDRCNNPKEPSYRYYGARGITVCKEWMETPRLFYEWAIENGYSDELIIDRINNDRGYEPENCRWVDRFISNQNRRSSHILEFRGEKKPLSVWAREFGMKENTLFSRINTFKLSVEKSLTKPLYVYEPSKKTRKKRIWAEKTFSYSGGEIKITEVMRLTGLADYTIRKKLCRKGWTVEELLSKYKAKEGL